MLLLPSNMYGTLHIWNAGGRGGGGGLENLSAWPQVWASGFWRDSPASDWVELLCKGARVQEKFLDFKSLPKVNRK